MSQFHSIDQSQYPSSSSQKEYEIAPPPIDHMAANEYSHLSVRPHQEELFHEIRRQLDQNCASVNRHKDISIPCTNVSSTQQQERYFTHDNNQDYSRLSDHSHRMVHDPFMEQNREGSFSADQDKDDDDVIIVSSSPSPTKHSNFGKTTLNQNQERFDSSVVYAGKPW